MNGWDWLTKQQYTWGFIGRVLLKATLLFVGINVLYALLAPLPFLGHLSVYGVFVPYRERLPYGETSQANNLSLNSLEAMFATHELNRPKAPDEFRVLFIGDSATWGIQLENQDTTTGRLNRLGLNRPDGKRVVAYNVGHPIMSVSKDLILIDYAKKFEPDLVVWLVTLESLPLSQQFAPPLVQNNAPRIRTLIQQYALPLNPEDERLVTPNFLDQTLYGERRAIADWLRLQLYGFAWANTHIDQVYPPYEHPTNDFEEDVTWYEFTEPKALSEQDIALSVLRAGKAILGEVPLLFVNEPIFIATGENSDLRYNFWYPRWAYDSYLVLMEREAMANDWLYLNLWDLLPTEQFTDSPVHLSPQGSQQLAEQIGAMIVTLK